MRMPQPKLPGPAGGASFARPQGPGGFNPTQGIQPQLEAPGVKGPNANNPANNPNCPDGKCGTAKEMSPQEVATEALKGAMDELKEMFQALLDKLKEGGQSNQQQGGGGGGPEGAGGGGGPQGASGTGNAGNGANTGLEGPCPNCGAEKGQSQGSCGDTACPGDSPAGQGGKLGSPQGTQGTQGSGGSGGSGSCGSGGSCGGPSGAGSPGGAGGNNGLGVGPLPPDPRGASAPSSELARFPGVNDPTLQRHLNELATDPEGKNLLEEAKRRGVSIQRGQPIQGALAHFDPNKNSITIGDNTLRNGTGLKSLIHELVHATTPENNSRHEEGMANVIAERISSRVQGRPQGNLNQVYNNTIPLYRNSRIPDRASGFDERINNVLTGRIRSTG
jgi:hypothetical protein